LTFSGEKDVFTNADILNDLFAGIYCCRGIYLIMKMVHMHCIRFHYDVFLLKLVHVN